MSKRILVIESPLPQDENLRALQGEVLGSLFRFLGIKAKYISVTSRTEFIDLLSYYSLSHEFVHIAGHGDHYNYYFNDTSYYPWDELLKDLSNLKNKIVTLSACHSSALGNRVLNDVFNNFFKTEGGPLAIMTLFSIAYTFDCSMAWALFYRHLFINLDENGRTSAQCASEDLVGALECVKDAKLPSIKICAAHWDTVNQRYKNISPWKPASI